MLCILIMTFEQLYTTAKTHQILTWVNAITVTQYIKSSNRSAFWSVSMPLKWPTQSPFPSTLSFPLTPTTVANLPLNSHSEQGQSVI